MIYTNLILTELFSVLHHTPPCPANVVNARTAGTYTPTRDCDTHICTHSYTHLHPQRLLLHIFQPWKLNYPRYCLVTCTSVTLKHYAAILLLLFVAFLCREASDNLVTENEMTTYSGIVYFLVLVMALVTWG